MTAHSGATRVQSDTLVRWYCSCGAEGKASRAYTGEDVEVKARWNHIQHARRAVSRT